MTNTTPTLPHLTWNVRPHAMACQRSGCGREPLCGFLSEDGEVFMCACCYTDGGKDGLPGVSKPPRFRTPEERKRILRGSSE